MAEAGPRLTRSPASPATAWVLTDGKAGDLAQCLGLSEALGLVVERRDLSPRPLFSLFMPWGPIDPAEAPHRAGSPLRPPFPDLVVASGRRAVSYVRTIKRASGGRTFTVLLKDPRTGTGAADLIWVPEHDRLHGPNVIRSVIGPHLVSAARLEAARTAPDPRLSGLPGPRVAVLVGGDSRHHRFQSGDIERFKDGLSRLAASGASLMITTSRRTPPALAHALQQLAERTGGFFWDATSKNPLVAMLALADWVVATADSTNMIGEAAATGRPILVFSPSGGHQKIAAFLEALTHRGIVHPFAGTLEGCPYEPLDETPAIAGAVRVALDRHRTELMTREAG